MEVSIFNPAVALDNTAEMQFLELADFGPGSAGAFWSQAGGQSPWEMHPDCDELLQIIEGEIEVEVLPVGNGDSHVFSVPAGSSIVIPQGCWHRQTIMQKTRQFYLTPGQTFHSTAEDPRQDKNR